MSVPEPQQDPVDESDGATPTSPGWSGVLRSVTDRLPKQWPSLPPLPARLPGVDLVTKRPAPSEGLIGDLSMKAARFLDRTWGWDRLPMPLSVVALMGLRMTLRRENLYDPSGTVVPWGPETPADQRSLTRSLDGSGTDPYHRAMGSAGSVFGRNVPLADTVPHDELEPNPRTISNELLDRGDTFIPAPSLNLLIAAWIQFEVHDWMSHGTNDPKDPWKVPLQDGDDFPAESTSGRVGRARSCRSAHPGQPGRRTAHLPQHRRATGGTPPRSTAARRELADSLRTWNQGHLRLSPRQLVPLRPAQRPRPARRSSSRREAAGGWAWRCSTRSSCASTTPSATSWPTLIPTGTTSGSTRRPASSTPL